jgi:hypothetical protein
MGWLWSQTKKDDKEIVSPEHDLGIPQPPRKSRLSGSFGRTSSSSLGKRPSQDVPHHPLHEKISERAMNERNKDYRTNTVPLNIATLPLKPRTTRQGRFVRVVTKV